MGVGHTNGFVKGIGGVSTLMRYYGRDAVPLGAYKGAWARDPHAGRGSADRYLSDLTGHWPAAVRTSAEVPNATAAYRAVLAAQPDRSVRIASIGITTNMRDLVASGPDAHSPLGGRELVAQKVELVVWMDMMYNFGCAQAASDDWLGPDTGGHGSARAAVMNWPPSVKQIFSPLGGDVLHGGWLRGCATRDNPCRQAFEDWGVGGTGRSSWDPIAVLLAARGPGGVHCKEVDAGGWNEVAESGKETWHPGSGSNQSRVVYDGAAQAAISFELNQLLCKPPGPWGGNWTAAPGFNCYEGHGATDLEPGHSSAGTMSLAQCQAKCAGTAGCTSVTVSPAAGGAGLVNCYRKADVVLSHCDRRTGFSTYVHRSWAAAGGYNCWAGHGARDIDGGTPGATGLTVAQCRALCERTEGCGGVVFQGADGSGVGSCYRKAAVDLNECDVGTAFDTHVATRRV